MRSNSLGAVSVSSFQSKTVELFGSLLSDTERHFRLMHRGSIASASGLQAINPLDVPLTPKRQPNKMLTSIERDSTSSSSDQSQSTVTGDDYKEFRSESADSPVPFRDHCCPGFVIPKSGNKPGSFKELQCVIV